MKQVSLLLLLFALRATAQPENPTPTMNLLIDNKGAQLYTTIYPNATKETVILLHGGPGFPSDLTEVAQALSTHYQVIVFHQRGTLLSPCPSRDYSMDAYVSDVEAVAAHFKLDKFHLFGHSWGGLYAQIYTQNHPEKLLSLFLCCPGSGTGAEWKQTEKEVMQLNKSKTSSWQWMKMGVNNLLGILGSDKAYARLFKQVMHNYNDGFIDTEKLDISFDQLKAAPINRTRPEIVKYPLLQVMEHPVFPVTIVYGDQDIYQSSKNFVLRRYPTAAVQTIEHCGHLPWLHNPERYGELLKAHYKM